MHVGREALTEYATNDMQGKIPWCGIDHARTRKG